MAGFGGLENVTLLNNYGSLFGYPFVIFPGVQMVFHIISPSQRGDFSCEFMSPKWHGDTFGWAMSPLFLWDFLVMQNISAKIFHQPRFTSKYGDFPSSATFWGEHSCEVAIIWPENIQELNGSWIFVASECLTPRKLTWLAGKSPVFFQSKPVPGKRNKTRYQSYCWHVPWI